MQESMFAEHTVVYKYEEYFAEHLLYADGIIYIPIIPNKCTDILYKTCPLGLQTNCNKNVTFKVIVTAQLNPF